MNPNINESEEVVTRQTTTPPASPSSSSSGETAVYRQRTTSSGSRLGQLVWLAAGVVDLVLALDFVLKLAGANITGFVAFIGGLASALAVPFAGIFTTHTAAVGRVTQWADIVAIIIYTAAAWIVVRLIEIVSARQPRSTQV